MKEKHITRRQLLVRGLQLPVGGALLIGLGGCGGSDSGSIASAAVCADPDAMTSGERALRASMNYTEKSTNPQQVCAGCAFFHAGEGQCGTCDMFTGGPANRDGRCDSWSSAA